MTSKSFLRAIILWCISGLLLTSTSHAFTSIVTGPGVPLNVDQALQNATTTQFNATITQNPLVPNTWSVKVLGLNPNYNPPPSNADLLNGLISVDSYTYVYGWANGMVYDRFSNISRLVGLSTLCDSTSTWSVNGSSWNFVTVDSTTCRTVLGYSTNQLYQLNYATPTVVPGF